MAVPISQMWTVATYVLKQKLKGRRRYPLVLMLEPLFRCNLACAGCGKIQYPAHILKTDLTPEECFARWRSAARPMVSIPGGEPLLHPRMPEIVAGLVARRKYVYLCTNALLLKEKLHLFKPSKYLSFSVHVDGQREHHDLSVVPRRWVRHCDGGRACRGGGGFRVTTNTTLFDGADPNSVRAHFDEMMAAGVESMMVSPGYTYDKAPDQNHFLARARSRRLFRAILSIEKKNVAIQYPSIIFGILMGSRTSSARHGGCPRFRSSAGRSLATCYRWLRRTPSRSAGFGEWEKYGAKSGTQVRQLHGALRGTRLRAVD